MSAPAPSLLTGLGPEARLAALGGSARHVDPPGEAARVVAEHRGGYELEGASGAWLAQLRGGLKGEVRRDARARPVVGDWVAVETTAGHGRGARLGVIARVLPRQSLLVRRAAGSDDLPQPMAANVDQALVLTAANGEFSPRRLERYLATIREGGAAPVLVVTKADAAPGLAETLAAVRAVAGESPVVALSVHTGEGLSALEAALTPGGTRVLLGSSGVGKSTLVNHWLGAERQRTGAARADDKGRHTTTTRQLFVLPGGGSVIDTPGLREIAPFEGEGEGGGVADTFGEITAHAAACRFRDCGHGGEPGCAVKAAVAAGEVRAERLAAYRALQAGGGTRGRRSSARR